MKVVCYKCHTVADKKDKKCKKCGTRLIKGVNPVVDKLIDVLGFCLYTTFGLVFMYQAIFEMKHLGNRVFFTFFGLFMIPAFYDVLGFIFPYAKIKTTKFTRILYIVLFVSLGWFLTVEYSGGPSQIVSADQLNYEVIREGFKELEERNVIDLKIGVEKDLQSMNLKFSNLKLDSEKNRFIITFYTNDCEDLECSIDYFVRTTRALYIDEELYPYICDLNVIFRFYGEESYIFKYSNMYLKDDNYLEKDGVVINVKTNNAFLLEDYKEGLIDVESISTDSVEVRDYKGYVKNWITKFKYRINSVNDLQAELSNKHFVIKSSATKEQVSELSQLTEEAIGLCNELSRVDVPQELKVLRFYTERSCEFYALGFELAVSGFDQSDDDTIYYSERSYLPADYYLKLAESIY